MRPRGAPQGRGRDDADSSGALWTAGFLLWLGAILGAGGATAQVPPLSRDNVPKPSTLAEYIRDEQAAIILGKALFWDMQVGGDNVQACATCHFRAGADTRKEEPGQPRSLARRVRVGRAEQPHR